MEYQASYRQLVGDFGNQSVAGWMMDASVSLRG